MQATIVIDHSALEATGLTVEQFQTAASTALSTLNCPVTGNPIYFNGVQVFVETPNPSTVSQSAPVLIKIDATEKVMTEQDMKDRISSLGSEMDANEEENRFLQTEIDALYVKIDALKAVTN